MGDPLTIGELAARSGLPTSTLRYYDRIGLIPVTSRSGGQRRYDPKVLQRVRAVTLCQRSGFSLEETRRLLDGGRPWQTLARRKIEELQDRIAELEQTTTLLRGDGVWLSEPADLWPDRPPGDPARPGSALVADSKRRRTRERLSRHLRSARRRSTGHLT